MDDQSPPPQFRSPHYIQQEVAVTHHYPHTEHAYTDTVPRKEGMLIVYYDSMYFKGRFTENLNEKCLEIRKL